MHWHHCKSDDMSDLWGVINNDIESIHQVLRLCGFDVVHENSSPFGLHMSQIISLVTKQGDPEHWNSMINGLIYAINASMSDECSGFGVTWIRRQTWVNKQGKAKAIVTVTHNGSIQTMNRNQESLYYIDFRFLVGLYWTKSITSNNCVFNGELCGIVTVSVARFGGLPPNWASFDRFGPENNSLGG